MPPQEELDQIYISIGEGAEITDEMLDRIKYLEDLICPRVPIKSIKPSALCGDPYCNGFQCWDCAAIRGGCPEDA